MKIKVSFTPIAGFKIKGSKVLFRNNEMKNYSTIETSFRQLFSIRKGQRNFSRYTVFINRYVHITTISENKMGKQFNYVIGRITKTIATFNGQSFAAEYPLEKAIAKIA